MDPPSSRETDVGYRPGEKCSLLPDLLPRHFAWASTAARTVYFAIKQACLTPLTKSAQPARRSRCYKLLIRDGDIETRLQFEQQRKGLKRSDAGLVEILIRLQIRDATHLAKHVQRMAGRNSELSCIPVNECRSRLARAANTEERGMMVEFA